MARIHCRGLLLSILLSVIIVVNAATDCDLDSSAMKKSLRRCRKQEETFLEKYNTMRVDVKGDRVACRLYKKYKACMQPLLANCTDIREEFDRRWKPVHKFMKCACENRQKGCKREMTCMRQQLTSLLVRRCETMYRFQKRQGVYDECRLLQDMTSCKFRLLDSACGPGVAEAGMHFHKLSHHLRHRSYKCRMTSRRQSTGFSYSSSCPSNLTVQADKCYNDYIRGEQLLFLVGNDLIASGSSSDVDHACRLHTRYKQCMEPLERGCKEGINLMHSMNGRVRIYLLKVDYICNKARTEIKENLQCLQNTIKNQTLKSCDPLWNKVHPYLKQTSAFQFYCQSHVNSSDVYTLHRRLRELRDCYQDRFNIACGDVAGKAIGHLMHQVFKDPFYLNFQHRPPCFSNLKATVVPPTEAPTTTNRKHRYIIMNNPTEKTKTIYVSARKQNNALKNIYSQLVISLSLFILWTLS